MCFYTADKMINFCPIKRVGQIKNQTFYDHNEKYARDVEKECAGAWVKTGLRLPHSVAANADRVSEEIDRWLSGMGLRR